MTHTTTFLFSISVKKGMFVYRCSSSMMAETCDWLLLPQHRSAYVIAHCGGSFHFQFIYYHFLSDEVLIMKKAKAPLLGGNEIISATAMNDIKLIDYYSFIHIVLSKFSDMFQIAEKKKGFFPHLFNRPEFWITEETLLDLLL